MNKKELNHLKNLKNAPTIDAYGKWVFCRNTKTASRSIENSAIRSSRIKKRKQNRKWRKVWNNVIVPNRNDIFFFTFVRNPWDRIVSSFSFLQNLPEDDEHKISLDIQFEEYVINYVAKYKGMHDVHFLPQYLSFTYNNKIIKDIFVGRFENLYEDWGYVASVLKIESKLPFIGKGDHVDYRLYYNQKTYGIIKEVYKKEIELLGYKFD